MPPEFFQPFKIKKGTIARIPASYSGAGRLELQVVSGGPVYMFRGGLDRAGAEQHLGEPSNIDFDLGAAVGQSASINMEHGIGELTVYSPDADSIGFLRFVGECGCHRG